MSLKERLTKFATTPGGVIPASPGFMPDDARKVLALIAAATVVSIAAKAVFGVAESGSITANIDAALAAMEAE